MTLTVYNTFSGKREAFEPHDPQHVRMYACGVTVYDLCHIGHGMQAIIYDVIRRYLEFSGFKVTYVRNHTDVDDKIIARAAELGIPPLEHAQNMIHAAQDDLALLGVENATHEPKVSDHIDIIIDLVQTLIDKGKAYPMDGDVYFRVHSFPDYGQLSNRKLEEMRSGVRVDINQKKEDPMDFAVWKAAKPGEISWPSPWGPGRPGWHIECSALATKFLGAAFDIHGGGKDLIFPHHENEIAQSRAADHAFARYWIHNGLVTVEGRKMSKSFNNFITIQDAVKRYDPETIRLTILSHHYSADIDFSEKSFYDAYQRLLYFYNTLWRVETLSRQFPDPDPTVPVGVRPPSIREEFTAAMDDDFNTAVALRQLGQGFKWLNEFLDKKKPKLKQKVFCTLKVRDELEQCAKVLGLFARPPQQALEQIQNYLVRSKKLDIHDIEEKVAARDAARRAKDWAMADSIRDELQHMGIQIMDDPTGTRWQVVP